MEEGAGKNVLMLLQEAREGLDSTSTVIKYGNVVWKRLAEVSRVAPQILLSPME